MPHVHLSQSYRGRGDAARAAWQVGGTTEDSHARYAAAARQSALPGDPPRQARHLADQCRLSLQPVLLPLPRQCRAEPHRGNAGRDRRRGARFRQAPAHRARSTSPAARPNSTRNFRRLVTTAREHRRQGDGPLQSHHPGAAGPGRPRRSFWPRSASRSSPRCPAICRTMSSASAARACSTARSAA